METITLETLIARINQQLSKRSERLCVNRGRGWRSELGEFYVVDDDRNLVVAQDVNLIDLADELDIVRDGEIVDRF